jgi:hypothetical protein
MTTARITVRFHGRIQGALGVCYQMERRRTVTLPDVFTEAEAREEARKALYERDAMDTDAYENVRVTSVAFN